MHVLKPVHFEQLDGLMEEARKGSLPLVGAPVKAGQGREAPDKSEAYVLYFVYCFEVLGPPPPSQHFDPEAGRRFEVAQNGSIEELLGMREGGTATLVA
jgi:hypothetical protein